MPGRIGQSDSGQLHIPANLPTVLPGRPYRHSRVSGNPESAALCRRILGKQPPDSRLHGNDDFDMKQPWAYPQPYRSLGATSCAYSRTELRIFSCGRPPPTFGSIIIPSRPNRAFRVSNFSVTVAGLP